MLSKMQLAQLAAFAMTLATSEAAYQGFNYGNKFSDESSKFQADFEAEFKAAKNLVGTSGFTSARLYTMIVRLPQIKKMDHHNDGAIY